MAEHIFQLDSSHIELYKLLKVVGVAESGGQAKQLIRDGEVFVNGEVEMRKRRKIVVGYEVQIFGEHIAVTE